MHFTRATDNHFDSWHIGPFRLNLVGDYPSTPAAKRTCTELGSHLGHLTSLGFRCPLLMLWTAPPPAREYRIVSAAADQDRRDRSRQQDRQNGLGHDGQGRTL